MGHIRAPTEKRADVDQIVISGEIGNFGWNLSRTEGMAPVQSDGA